MSSPANDFLNSLKRVSYFILFIIGFEANAQTYFPPNNSGEWDTITPSTLNWCAPQVDSLYNFLESNNTKAFILLKDGKIVLEQYFNGHDAQANWYWASAGKTLTAFMVGMAQEENFLEITDTTSDYLGEGWTSLTPEQEEKITIWHQLTMTSGLDDRTDDIYCTDDTCLTYLAEPGTRWAYHNGPYTLLDGVIQSATGQTLNTYMQAKLKSRIGMNGLFLQQGFNNVYFSNARSMARFGLLMLNNGNWNGTQIMTDTDYLNDMINMSQSINESYGYLWWLNGKDSFMTPQLQFVFNGSISPNAPDDMYVAAGKNGQYINVIPSENMVWIRMGDAADNSLVPFTFNDDIWGYINQLPCDLLSVASHFDYPNQKTVYPNPVQDQLYINGETINTNYAILNSLGEQVALGIYDHSIDVSGLLSGTYYLKLRNNQDMHFSTFIKE